MNDTRNALLLQSRRFSIGLLCMVLMVALLAQVQTTAQAQERRARSSQYVEENNQIRRDKLDIVLPQVMRENGIDMWIHVVREAIPDSFGADELGSTSGVFVFTDRGGDRIERAILERRWGAEQRERVASEYEDPMVKLDAYDIIATPIFILEPVAGPMTEYDYRFKGLRQFVAERDPQRIAVNFKRDLGPWPTYQEHEDGLSHTDYILLTEELGEKYADRLVSSEYLLVDYMHHKVDSEIELLKKMRAEEVEQAKQAFAAIEPGVTPNRGAGVTVFRRTSTGLSQRGRSAGWENAVIQGGDIVAAPSVGLFGYVLRDGETEAPAEIQRLWAEYLKVDKILAESIRSGLTAREIGEDYTRRFNEAGIVVKDEQLHMAIPKNDFAVYSAGSDPAATLISIDAHGHMKGARPESIETYFGPRIGSYGPDWVLDIPLQPNHHFVIEYFFYMPSPAGEGEDQYLFWWDHEEAIATPDGIEYLTPPQEELILIH
jgi:hypothetical protein